MTGTSACSLRGLLELRAQAALAAAGLDAPPAVAVAARPEFGDYQINGVMAAAKRTRSNPRELAATVAAALDLGGIAEHVDVAGPGFINVRLAPAYLATSVEPEQPLLVPTAAPQTVVVDYSAPNLAKEMHVGHLRSTIIGDAMVRVLQAAGHHAIRQNHVGDWGTQFGMLLAYLDDTGSGSDLLADLERFYQLAKQRFDADPAFAARARAQVVALQSGDARANRLWHTFIDISLGHCEAVYRRLGVLLERGDVRAESAYNDMLPGVLRALREAGLVTESDGAQCVFLDEFRGKNDAPLPLIVQKSDGAFLYSTTDLAAIAYRTSVLHADRVLYFVDARQALHFRQVFAVARKAGLVADTVSLEHHPFGAMLGRDGRPFRTRDGGVVKLIELLDEAEQRAYRLVSDKNPAIAEAERREIARVVGIGAVKYADLSKHRSSDYVFDWDAMLSFDGNTAPYLQYAYTRIVSLFEKGQVDPARLSGRIALSEPSERALALTLARYREVIDDVVDTALPHYLCGYLYELAARYMQFYERCPVLAATPAARASRLKLCKRTADTLAHGLGLLGIETVDRM
jgi:arginyl-tRNA synthetase